VSSCPHNPVRIGGTPYYYSSVQSAYNVTSDNQAVRMQAVEIAGDVTLQKDVLMRLQGGYNCDYSSNPGYTAIKGNLKIKGGTVIVDRVMIK
jgi:hypothetical protein